VSYTELKAVVPSLRKQWHADKVLIEDSAMGIYLLQSFRQQAYRVYLAVASVTK
jgi:hypothetical protein